MENIFLVVVILLTGLIPFFAGAIALATHRARNVCSRRKVAAVIRQQEKEDFLREQAVYRGNILRQRLGLPLK